MKNDFKKYKYSKLIQAKTIAYQKGFSLLELMITAAIGLVLFAGVLSVFVGMQSTVKETSGYGELQENARFAISVLTDDLLHQNFWGDYSGSLNLSSLDQAPNPAGVECTGGGVNNGTYPLAVGEFRTLWGETSAAAAAPATVGTTTMSCINDAVPNSDVIQLKRVIARPLAAATANFSYFMANADTGALYKVPVVAPNVVPVIANSRIWQYQHHVYYVRESFDVPVLMQWRLTNQMSVAPIIEGIERIYFMYGISNVIDPTAAGYGVVNAYVSAANMTQALWDNTNSNIVAVKMYILARSILPDNKYENKNTYKLGDQVDYTPDDNYRRLLLSSTVTLYNSEIDAW
ncbi:MAG: PilW family protein [Cognaticolwellia sp.]